MDPFLEDLGQVRHVEVPPRVYARLQRELQRRNAQNLRWWRAAAAVAVLLWGVEGYYLYANSNAEDMTTSASYALSFPTTDNSLYCE